MARVTSKTRLRSGPRARAGKAVGRGEKKLVLSGLREFDQQAMEQLIKEYEARKV